MKRIFVVIIFLLAQLVIKMLLIIEKIDLSSNFVVNLDKIKIR